MKITIETEDGGPGAVQQGLSQAQTQEDGTESPPAELAARAAAIGALSAGPAPMEARGEAPEVFTQPPGTPETTAPAGGGGEAAQSAGAAPDLSSQVVEEQVPQDEGAEGVPEEEE